MKLLAAALLCLIVFLGWPGSYATTLTPLLRRLAPRLDPDYRIERMTLDADVLRVEAESTKLNRFTLRDGRAPPTFSFTTDIRFGALNIYPVIMLTLLLVFPMKWRTKGLALAPVTALLLIAGALDVCLMLYWNGAQAFARAWPLVQEQVLMNPGTTALGEALQREFHRLASLKSFLSTGGRPFVALLLFALAMAPWWSRSGRTVKETDASGALNPDHEESAGDENHGGLP